MIGIKYQGSFFDLNPKSSISFELQNLVFVSSDASKLPGSFAFPFSLPLTQNNRVMLGFPDRIDRNLALKTKIQVSIFSDGKELFPGTLTIREVSVGGAGEINVNIVVNPLSSLRQTPLNELDLGGVRTFTDEAALLADAKDTTISPLNYDYVYFPIWNPDFTLSFYNGNPKSFFQNFYNVTTEAFEVDHEYPALMPFVRLEYLLNQIFSNVEYTFENAFQINDELKLICLYNNKSIWTEDGLPTEFDLKNHVSKTPATAFLRKIMGAFCLGIFYNTWSKKLRLVPIQSIISQAPKHNWTNKALHEYGITTNVDQPEVICWKEDSNDGAWKFYSKFKKPADADVDGEVTWDELVAGPTGLYYVTDRHAYYEKLPSRIRFVYQTLGCAPLDTGDPKFEAEAMALWDSFRYGEGHGATPNANYDLIAHCRIGGTVSYEETPIGGGDPETVSIENDCPDRITIYRGIQPNFDGDDYPLASGIPWNGEGLKVGDYSLRWDGQYGMYQSWWESWHNMLKSGKNVTMTFILTIDDLISFNFEDKIRIGNQDYFVSKMKVSFTENGLAPVTVNLISLI